MLKAGLYYYGESIIRGRGLMIIMGSYYPPLDHPRKVPTLIGAV